MIVIPRLSDEDDRYMAAVYRVCSQQAGGLAPGRCSLHSGYGRVTASSVALAVRGYGIEACARKVHPLVEEKTTAT